MLQRSRLSVLLVLALIISACGVDISLEPTGSQSQATGPTPTAATQPPISPSGTARVNASPQPIVATPSASAGTPTQAAQATPAAPAQTTPTAAVRVLEDRWYQDSDGNAIPDHIEVDLGNDPLVDDCTRDACAATGEITATETLTVEQQVLLMLDASGSMAAVAEDGVPKIDTARTALQRYASQSDSYIKLGFMVYGHKGNNQESGKAESCAGIEQLVPIGEVQRDTFGATLNQFQPTGWTPIAGALTEAQKSFAGKEGASNRIILVSDGIETCGGDPVAVAQQLAQQDIAVTIDIVGFGIENSDEAAQLRQIAEVTGGQYYDAQTAQQLDDYFYQQLKARNAFLGQIVCEVRNLTRVGTCGSRMATNAALRISKERDSFMKSGAQDKANALQAIIDQIYQRYDQRYQSLLTWQSRIGELNQQFQELDQQLPSSSPMP